jgi:hypothetical protein
MIPTMFKLKRNRKKRPLAITLIAWAIFVLFLVRLYQAIEPLLEAGIFQNGLSGPLLNENLRLTTLGGTLAMSAPYAFLSLSGLIVLIGFLRMKRWSWIVLMVWTTISLTVSLLGYFYDQPNYIVMASDTIIALSLNQTNVQQIFKIRNNPEVQND